VQLDILVTSPDPAIPSNLPATARRMQEINNTKRTLLINYASLQIIQEFAVGTNAI
jgi:hypothetical protein